MPSAWFPMLDQSTPRQVKKGAPETYASPKSTRQGCKPRRWPPSCRPGEFAREAVRDLATFFRMQSLEKTLLSIEEGLRKYWNPALADFLNGQMAENGPNRERLPALHYGPGRPNTNRNAPSWDHEAQRCRGMLASSPAALPRRRKNKWRSSATISARSPRAFASGAPRIRDANHLCQKMRALQRLLRMRGASPIRGPRDRAGTRRAGRSGAERPPRRAPRLPDRIHFRNPNRVRREC